jgi:hypothetical protein
MHAARGALSPAIRDIEAVLAALSEFRDKPAGSFVRGSPVITSTIRAVVSRPPLSQ